jgi:hypothetical protein
VRMADGSITVPTEVPEGTSVWFSSRDKEKITSRFDRMAKQITEQLGDDKPKLVFQFECFTRGKSLFREQEKVQLLKRLRQSVGPEVPWAGFYTIRGDWSCRGAQPSSSVHVCRACPQLTMKRTIP